MRQDAQLPRKCAAVRTRVYNSSKGRVMQLLKWFSRGRTNLPVDIVESLPKASEAVEPRAVKPSMRNLLWRLESAEM